MPRIARITPYVVLAAAVAIVFGQAVGFGFVKWDDTLLITQNPYYLPLTWASLGRLLQSAFGGLYMPLTYAYWAALSVVSQTLDASGGARFDPRVYHAGNLVLHAGCGALVYAIAVRLVPSRVAACLGALVFLVHPLQVESVCWVTESKGLLAAFFSLAALWLMMPQGEGEANAWPSWPRYALAIFCFQLAMTAKPSAVALPLVVLAVQWIVARRRLTDVLLGLGPWFALAGIWVAVTRGAQPTVALVSYVAPWQRAFVAGDALAFYLGKLVWPLPVAIDYGRTPGVALGGALVYVAWLVPVAVGGLAWVLLRQPVARAGVLIFFGSLLPVTGLVAFQFQRVSTVADRYMYVPLVGVALIVAAVVARGGRVAAAVASLVVLGLGFVSWSEAPAWRDDLTLFSHALKVNPRSDSALVDLGATYYERKQTLLAEDYYTQAIAFDPPEKAAYSGKASILSDRGQYAEALALYEKALASDPELDWAHAGAGKACHALGDTRAARGHYEKALTPNPRDNSTNLTSYETALAANRLARILATDRDASLRDGREAVRRAREAGKASRWQVTSYLDTMAAAYAEAGEFERAVTTARRAVERATAQQKREQAERLLGHLRLFESRQPLRETAAEQIMP